MAIAHTLLKIAYQVLKTGTPYTDLGVGFYASREAPQARQAYLIRQLQKLNPGCRILGAADAYQAMREPRPGVPFQLVPVVGEVVASSGVQRISTLLLMTVKAVPPPEVEGLRL